MAKIPTTLIEELVKRGVLDAPTSENIISQVKKTNREFGELLVETGIISDADLLKIKTEIYKIPSVSLTTYDILKDALKILSEDVISFYKILPFDKKDNVLKVGIINPEDINALEALKFISEDKGLVLEKYLISYSDFNEILKGYKNLVTEVSEALQDLSNDINKKAAPTIKEMSGIVTDDAPITKTVAAMVKHAVEGRASDIHIEPCEDKLKVRFRIDGVLQVALVLPKSLHSAIITRIKILSDLQIDETRKPQDGRFSTKVGAKKVDFRVSTLPTRYGEKIVMRILDPLVGLIDLPELGLVGRNLDLIFESIEKPFGSILITGPTGSGKTTTLYAILRRISSEGVNTITLEDPIEFLIDGVNQSQMQEEIGYTFASGLRHVLRQDPDIVMVGEIRDGETASLATHAALTGHLVLSTLHTNDAIGIVPRLVDMGVEKYLIAPTLNLGVAQRLLRKLCPVCKVEIKPNAAQEAMIKKAVEGMPADLRKKYDQPLPIYKASEKGCKECKGKAYKGRIAIFEVLEMTDQLEEIILTSLSEASIRKEAQRQGMITMFQDGIIKTLDGIISLEELLEVAEAGSA